MPRLRNLQNFSLSVIRQKNLSLVLYSRRNYYCMFQFSRLYWMNGKTWVKNNLFLELEIIRNLNLFRMQKIIINVCLHFLNSSIISFFVICYLKCIKQLQIIKFNYFFQHVVYLLFGVTRNVNLDIVHEMKQVFF